MKRAILLTVLVLSLLLTLTACGGPKVVDEDRMLADVSSQFDMAVETGHYCILDELEIEKRQTNTKDKEDIIYVWCSGEDNEVACRIGLELTYILYNDGWALDSIARYEESSWYYTPLTGPTQDLFYYYLQDTSANFEAASLDMTDVTTEIDLLSATCSAALTVSYNYMNEVTYVDMQALFDQTYGYWDVIDATHTTEKEWLVLGTWFVDWKDLWQGHTTTLEITDVTGDMVTCSYVRETREGQTTSGSGTFMLAAPFESWGTYHYEIECGEKMMRFYLCPQDGVCYRSNTLASGTTTMTRTSQ